MARWLIKTEPETFSWDDQVRRGAGGEAWTGVRNHTAKNNLIKMRKGERALFYHSGEGVVVGIVEVIREAYPDPTDASAKFVAVDVKAIAPLARPVTLATIKAEPRLAGMALVKFSRLSVQPVRASEWNTICRMGGLQ